MDPARASHARSVEHGERTVRRHFATLAKEIAAIVQEVGGDEPLRAEHHGQIMRRVDRALDRLYPEQRGGPSLLEEEIVRSCDLARRRGVKVAMAEFAPALRADPAIRKRLDGAG